MVSSLPKLIARAFFYLTEEETPELSHVPEEYRQSSELPEVVSLAWKLSQEAFSLPAEMFAQL